MSTELDNEVVLEEDTNTANVLEMSDEDFLNSATYEESPSNEETVTESELDDNDSDAEDTQIDEAPNQGVQDQDTEATADVEDTKQVEETDFDYKTAYEQIIKPFKANGKDIQVNSVEDAVSLMQMGANYQKKMSGLKPSLKILKLLENNNLLDESKLNFLIDLDNKNPEAITKLIKESGIDPFELDTEKANEYRPTNRSVDDRAIALDTVLEEMQDSPTYTRTLDIVSKQWDGSSKQTIAAQPQLLKVINDHMASGIYDIISTEVERERMFGRLDGLSNIDAYRKIGDAIQARGGFNHIGNPTPNQPVIVTPKPKADDTQLKEKRRAASSTPIAAKATGKSEFNPLSMSDAEFSKMSASQFY